jgi:hypothetical protein
MFDEFNQPNTAMRELLGVEQTKLDESNSVKLEKQDLPFAESLDTVTWNAPEGQAKMPVIGARSRIQLKGAEAAGAFGDGSPAITVRKTGKGSAVYCGFLPGLSYFKPAIPKRPVDRGTTDNAMAHFVPTAFDAAASRLVALPATDVERPVACSEPLVETTVIQSPHGTLIPLANWSGKPVKGLTVTVSIDVPTGKVELASGGPVQAAKNQGKTVFTLDLDVADALILR